MTSPRSDPRDIRRRGMSFSARIERRIEGSKDRIVDKGGWRRAGGR